MSLIKEAFKIPVHQGAAYLIVGPSWLGDMIMAQSLFRHLKTSVPSCSIDVLALDWTQDVLRRMPEVDHIILMPIGHGKLSLKDRYKFGKLLQKQNYQRAYVLPNTWKSALIPFWANIPQRIGWLGEMRFGLLNNIYYYPKKIKLMYQRYVALAYPKSHKHLIDSLPPKLVSDELQRAQCREQFKLDMYRQVIGIAPGAASGMAKCWPVAYFIQLISYQLKQKRQVWLFGSKSDSKLNQKIIKCFDSKYVIDFSGYLNLSQTVDMIAMCDVFISNDSGLMHISAALDKPMISLFGPTSSQHTPPLNLKAKVIERQLACRPCYQNICPLKHHRCMKDISAQEVNNILEKLFT